MQTASSNICESYTDKMPETDFYTLCTRSLLRCYHNKKQLMKYYLCIVLLAGVFNRACAQSDVATAKWMAQPVVIDGENTEWGRSLNFYDVDTKLSFALGSDSNNIYLCFESENGPNQMKIMRAGMNIELSTKGKNKHEVFIAYPLPQKEQEPAATGTDTANNGTSSFTHQVHDAASFKTNYLGKHTVMDVKGFASANGEVPVKNASGLNVAMNWDSASNLIYEIAIPKKEFFGAHYSPKEASEEITLSVEVNALKHMPTEGGNKNSDGESHGEGMNGGGMHGSGMEGGGMHGGGSYGGGKQWSEADRESLGVKTSFKQKFVLGTKDAQN
jgi:hypothetical protein